MRRGFCSWFFLIVLISSHAAASFQSDELLVQDDDLELEAGIIDQTTSVKPSYKKTSSGRDASPFADSKSSIRFSLEHNLGGSGHFITAGTFNARIKPSTQGGGPILTKLRFSRNLFSAAEKDAFERLLRDDDYYTIRLPSNILYPPGKDYVISSVRARCLAREGLDEHFVLHMEGGNVLAVSYGSSGACQYPRLFKQPNKWVFISYTVLKYGEQARRTPTFVEDMIATQNGDSEGVKTIEKSFWAKYWMYLIPLGFIILNAVTQGMNMPEEQASGQGQQPVGQRTANAAPRRR